MSDIRFDASERVCLTSPAYLDVNITRSSTLGGYQVGAC